MDGEAFEATLKAFGGEGSLRNVSAFERNRLMYFRSNTDIDKYFNELVHEGTHALDSASGIVNDTPRLIKETGDIIHEGEKMDKYIKGFSVDHLIEFRARIFEREFQIASKQTLDFKTVKELIEYIKIEY